MIKAALASALLFAGYRSVAVVGSHLFQLNVAGYNHVRGLKDREAVHTGCGCMIWRETDE